jgi:hypothetical protein
MTNEFDDAWPLGLSSHGLIDADSPLNRWEEHVRVLQSDVLATPALAARLQAEFSDILNVRSMPLVNGAESESVLLVRTSSWQDLKIPFKPISDHLPGPEITLDERRAGAVAAMRLGFAIISDKLPCPTAPGVEAMLADGWWWDGFYRFAKHNGKPPAQRWSEKYSSFIHEKLVRSGRYAERLPTNRSCKRARAKERRRARRQAAR